MIQASSLTAIHSVADQPPSKPSFKRSGGGQLNLYIERVPGSRDVFLTTLKPRDKTVTAHDVESSLYYCHLESEQDDVLATADEELDDDDYPPEPANSAPPVPSHGNARDSDHPPPVPEHRVLPNTSSHPPALPLRPAGLAPSPEVKRKPVGASSTSATATSVSQQHGAPALPSRPTGPRPPGSIRPQEMDQNQQSYSTSVFFSQDGYGQSAPNPPQLPPRRPASNYAADSFDFNDPYPTFVPSPPRSREGNDLRPQTSPTSRSPYSWDASMARGSVPGSGFQADRPPLSPRSNSSAMTRSNSVASAAMSVGSVQEPALRGFNVILIRRDPSTGTQTNVGKITMPPPSPRTGRAGKALIQLFNPGYEKFRSARGTSTADLVRCISEDDGCTYSCDLRLATRRRSMKNPSAPYFGDVPVNQLISVSPSQPYSFLSPWNRVCEFSTGVSGRSLKCRHMLARGTLMDDNPNDMNVISLSELRFNTPSSSVFAKVGSPKRATRHLHSVSVGNGSAASSTASLPRKPPRKLSMSRLSNDGGSSRSTFDTILEPGGNASSSSVFDNGSYQHRSDGASSLDSSMVMEENNWDLEPMDLALGQERAGGGFRGNKAKLGKLVIEPEGLEMLDLLVAANMGVWWSVR